MSHQYPGQYQQGPAPYQPPRPPKKGMSGGAIVAIVLGSVFGGLFLLLIIAVTVSDSSPSSTASEKTAVAGSSPKSEAKNEAEPVEQKTQKPTEAPAEPAPKKPAEFPNGDYVVGEDIPAGTYQTAGAEKGIFEFCSVTTDPVDEAKFPQLKSANAGERIIITLTEADGVVSISGCEPLTRR